MIDEQLAALLKLQSPEVGERGPFCPDDQDVAAYFDCALSDADHSRLERHLQACDYCLARIGLLGRLDGGGAQRAVPEFVLAKAKQITSRTEREGLRHGPVWAVAAALMLVFGAAVTVDRSTVPFSAGEGAIETPSAPSPRSLRGVTAAESRGAIEVRLPEGPLSIGSAIRWTEFADSLRYEVTVLSATGDVVWIEQLAANEWILSQAAGLDAGADYYLRVDAVLRDGQVLSSPHILLQPSERR